MYSLPDEQNKLLKEMGELDNQERAGIQPVRNNINLFLVFFTWAVGITATTLNVLEIRSDSLQIILIVTFSISFALILAYYNIILSKYLAVLAFSAGALYLSYLANWQNTALVILIDSVAVFVIANQFGRNGFILGFILFGGKAVALHFLSPNSQEITSLLAELINIFAIGMIPVLMLSISKVSRRAKKAEIRAQILSLQNQELVGSWGNVFQAGTQLSNQSPQPVNP